MQSKAHRKLSRAIVSSTAVFTCVALTGIVGGSLALFGTDEFLFWISRHTGDLLAWTLYTIAISASIAAAVLRVDRHASFVFVCAACFGIAIPAVLGVLLGDASAAESDNAIYFVALYSSAVLGGASGGFFYAITS